MKRIQLVLLAGAFAFSTSAANAETVGIGTSKGGANARIGSSIASVVSSNAGYQMRPQRLGGTQQYMPMVNAGRLEFGLSNVMQYYMAARGTGLAKGKPNSNLRLVATLMQFRIGVLVRKSDGITSMAGLKGKKVPTGFSASPLFQLFMGAFLDNGGLSWRDVRPRPVVSLRASWKAFKQGSTDAAIAAAGSAPVRDMNASISGGIVFLPLAHSAKTLEMLPRTRLSVVKPSKKSVALTKPMRLNIYDYVLFASAKTGDEFVYKAVKALYENRKALVAATPLWKSYKPANIGRNHNLAYHPGAIRFFREKGLATK
ncbi:MAG: TAXI family TRAP transporter solute-binding subunit [Alphaproteobacteria bacterium]